MGIYYNNLNFNRKTAVLSDWDEIYCNILKLILKEGTLKENRTGIDTISTSGTCFKLENLNEAFPILETKKVVIRNALTEILWFYQAKSNDVRWLQERDNPIWDLWMVDDDGIYRTYETSNEQYNPNKEVDVYDINGNKLLISAKSKIEEKNIKSAKYFGKEYSYTIGTAYGWIINRYNQIDEIIKTLKTDPNNRRMVVSLWQNEFLKSAVLPSCVWSFTLTVTNGKLNMSVNQRSCDVPLGLPFNVSQYAILLYIIAKEAGLEVGTLTWKIDDTHIYVNQLEGINKQIKEYDDLKRLSEYIQKNPDNRIINLYRKLKKDYDITKSEEIKREMDLIKHLLTRENPELILNKDKSLYTYNNVPNTDKEYLKENPTGNEDIMIRKYTYRPFIKMPIAQ